MTEKLLAVIVDTYMEENDVKGTFGGNRLDYKIKTGEKS